MIQAISAIQSSAAILPSMAKNSPKPNASQVVAHAQAQKSVAAIPGAQTQDRSMQLVNFNTEQEVLNILA